MFTFTPAHESFNVVLVQCPARPSFSELPTATALGRVHIWRFTTECAGDYRDGNQAYKSSVSKVKQRTAATHD